MSLILVTGASGYLGTALIAALARQGGKLRAAVRRPPPHGFPDGIEVFRHGDLTQPVDWRPALDGIDTVIHLAGIAHAAGADAERYDRVNRAATEQLANAAAKTGIKRFVFISSIRAQCGACADHVLTERDIEAPAEAYGCSKLAAEAAVRGSGVPFTILRPVVLYGPGAKGNVARLLRVAASPWPLPLKDFVNRRSLLGIDNFVSTVKFVMATPATLGETYIVADPGEPLPLCEVIAIMRRAQGRRPLLVPAPPAVFEASLRLLRRIDLWKRLGGELVVNAAKLAAAGWRPLHDTPSGLTALTADAAAKAVRTTR